MKTSRSREVKYYERVEYEVFGSIMAVRTTTGSNHVVDTFLASTADWKKRKSNPFKTALAIAKSPNRYAYLKAPFWDLYNQVGLGHSEIFDSWENNQVDPFKVITLKDFDINKVVRSNWGSHLLYHVDAKFPISPPYFVSWIGGVTGEDYNLNKAFQTLTASKHVWDVKRSRVRTYDPDDPFCEAIEYMTKMPQELFEKLCSWFQKDKYWSVRVKEMAAIKPWHMDCFKSADFDPDYLGLTQCFKKSVSSK